MITLILNEEEFQLLEEELMELNGHRANQVHMDGTDYNSAALRLIRSRATIEMPIGKYRHLVEELVDKSM